MRAICQHCHFPQSTCLCSAVEKIKSPIPIIILQHKNEVNHAKNTVRLLSLSLENLSVITHNNHTTNDNAISTALSKFLNPAVIYPSAESCPLEQSNGISNHDAYILLDGSWRQSRGMWLANPILQNLPHYHFANAGPSNYNIRHTAVEHGLSTLEAVAYTLSQTTGVDTSGLYHLQTAMQANWRGPEHHLRNHKHKQ